MPHIGAIKGKTCVQIKISGHHMTAMTFKNNEIIISAPINEHKLSKQAAVQ